MSDSFEEKFSQLLQDVNDAAWWGGLGDEKILSFTFQDYQCKMFLPYAHSDLIQRTILRTRSFYEHYLLLKIKPLIKPSSVVVDVGANIGNHTVFFSKVCGARNVYSFEPGRVAFSLLEKNIAINNLVGIVPVNVAIGSKGGRASLTRYSQKNIGGTMLSETSEGEYEVRTLDSFELEHVDFMKIDVESSEGLVLEGAKDTIERCRPNLLLEILSDSPDNQVRSRLRDYGYEQHSAVSKTDFLFEFRG